MTEAPKAVFAVIDAARKGEIDVLEALLADGGKADETDEFGNSALMYAAACGHPDICRRLIDAGASTKHANKWSMDARDWSRWSEKRDEVIAVLRGDA
ncbi:MAG: ankyrin repeat domain-containing protein [Rhodospirillales bacterium]